MMIASFATAGSWILVILGVILLLLLGVVALIAILG